MMMRIIRIKITDMEATEALIPSMPGQEGLSMLRLIKFTESIKNRLMANTAVMITTLRIKTKEEVGRTLKITKIIMGLTHFTGIDNSSTTQTQELKTSDLYNIINFKF